NFYFQLFLAFDSSGAFTFRAGVLDYFPGATTNVTGPRHREKSLLVTNLATASTGRTGFRLTARRRTRSFANVASLQTRNAQLRCHAVRSVFECDLQVVTKICATLCCTAARPAASAKDVAKTKQVAENVLDATKTRRAPGARTGTAGNACMTKPVVTPALLGVRQHAVGFGSLFEFLFRR